MARTREERDRETEARILNWSRWAWGGLPGYTDREEKPGPIDELDAEIVEAAMIRMKARRPYYWRVVRVRYLLRLATPNAAEALRRSEAQYKVDVAKVLAWTDGALDAVS